MRKKLKLVLVILILFSCSKNAAAQFDTARITVAGGMYDDECRQVIELRNGGFIAVGTTASFGQGNTDVYVIKTDSNLLCQWSETIGGPGIDRGYSVTETFDGGLAIAGFTNGYGAQGYDVLLIKTDSNGILQWVKTYGGTDWDFGYSLKQTTDSGFVICGESYSYTHGDADVLVVKTDANGNLTWIKNFGGPLKETGYSVAVRRSGNYVVAGKTLSFGSGNYDAYIVALNTSGDTLWTKTYGDAGNNAAYGIDTTLDDAIVFVGVTDSLGFGDTDGYFVKIDSMGNELWHQILGGQGNGVAQSVAQRMNGSGYIVAGSDNSYGAGGNGFFMTRTDAGGYWQAGPTFGGPADEEGYSVAISRFGGVVFGGTTTSYGHGLKDFYLVKLQSDSVVQDYTLDIRICTDTPVVAGITEQISNTLQAVVYPNPFHEWTEIVFNSAPGKHKYNFEVYNLTGQQVSSVSDINSERFRFYRGSLNRGLYYFFISDNGARIASGKLLID